MDSLSGAAQEALRELSESYNDAAHSVGFLVTVGMVSDADGAATGVAAMVSDREQVDGDLLVGVIADFLTVLAADLGIDVKMVPVVATTPENN